NGLGILATRLAQVSVQVDQTGQHDQTVCVDGLRAACRAGTPERTDLGDHAVADQHVLAAGAGDVGSLDQEAHATVPSPANRWEGTGVRTTTPAETWSRIKDCAASAASAAISRPRFIGPG